jgi:hypothetical protein
MSITRLLRPARAAAPQLFAAASAAACLAAAPPPGGHKLPQPQPDAHANDASYRTTCFYFNRPTTRRGEQACTVHETGSKAGYTLTVTLSDGARYSETTVLAKDKATFEGLRSIFAGPFTDSRGRFTCAGLARPGREEICFYIGRADILNWP